MWILDTEGDAFQGRRLWLAPGKKFLLGRTVTEGTPLRESVIISDKTISRKHLTIEIDAVGPEECANPRTRSKVTIEDLNTKVGTLINGEQISARKYVLDRDENTVKIGRYKHHFRLDWVPITFSFTFTAKETKANPYTALYERLGPLDIKVLREYERGQTTHLVAKKRNTSKGLLALIDGKYIVHNDSYLKAIYAAAIPASAEDRSPLEDDWAENFPNPLEYLPPRGEEPTQRDASAYAPDPQRQGLFEGYTFIFYDQRQFESLLAPITEGGGKALFRDVVPDQTEVDDFVRYVKEVAGEKGLGEFEDGSEGKGVVVVRFNPVKGAGLEWYYEFNRQVSLHLDHRLIEQNEFLDAILGNDASVLRRPLQLDPSGVVAPPPTANTAVTSQTSRSSQPALTPATREGAPSEPTRRIRSRRAATTRFKGFDDDDDPPMTLNSVPELVTVDPTPAVELQSQGLFVSQDPDMDVDTEPQNRSRYSRKRSSPPIDFEEEDADTMEQLAPAASRLKKRRLAEDAARRQRGESTPPPVSVKEKPAPKSLPKKAKEEVDILEVARQKREKAEELARAEREHLHDELNGMDIEAIRNLAIVEEMEVSRPQAPVRAIRADESDRWDDKWNGRKNFKQFRRRGAEVGHGRGFHRVIVPLEEAKTKDYGIGDEYWLEKDSHTKKKKGKGTDTQDINQSQSQTNPKGRAAARAAEILAKEAEEAQDRMLEEEVEANALSSSDVEVVAPPPRPAANSRSQTSQKLADKTSASQNLPAQKKRPAATILTKPAPVKKAKAAPVEVQDSDSDDDELKFKFRKRR